MPRLVRATVLASVAIAFVVAGCSSDSDSGDTAQSGQDESRPTEAPSSEDLCNDLGITIETITPVIGNPVTLDPPASGSCIVHPEAPQPGQANFGAEIFKADDFDDAVAGVSTSGATPTDLPGPWDRGTLVDYRFGDNKVVVQKGGTVLIVGPQVQNDGVVDDDTFQENQQAVVIEVTEFATGNID